MLRIALALSLLCACGSGDPVEAAAAPARGTPAELEPLFAAAERDPAQLVALVERASVELARLDPAAAHALAERLEPFCARLFFGSVRAPGMERVGLALYTVRSGDLAGKIARRYGFDHPLFERWNEGFDAKRLRVGQVLKLLDLSSAKPRLVVDGGRHRLGAWRVPPSGAPVLLAYLPVGLGAPETPTPPGTTRVVERVRDPEWTHPVTGKRYTAHDPENLLGGYWMRLDPDGIGREGIGLHGYTGDDPDAWLGKDVSNGCIRLRQDDIDRVFHLALAGTEVKILP